MDEKNQTYIWRKVKKLYQTHFAPLLFFFLFSCILWIKNVAKFGQGGGEIYALHACKKDDLCVEFLFQFS